MKTVTIKGSVREKIGTKHAKDHRRKGFVPAVIYGADENTHIIIDEREFNKIVYTPDVYNVKIDVDGKEYSTIFQDAQFHPVTDDVLHADFLMVQDGKPVKLKMPVKLTGSAIGVRNGGKLAQPMRRVAVKGMIDALPDGIEIDITKLRIGQSIKVGTLKIDGVEFLDPESSVMVAVRASRGAVDEDLDGEEDEEGEGDESSEEGEEKKEEASSEE
jgi:large subunit ribosomal protein L25